MRARLRGVLVAAGLVVFGVSLLPPVQARGKALLSLAEAVGAAIPRPLAPTIMREEIRLAGTSVDLYTPGHAAPAVLLVPGAAPAGRSDARVRRLASALARADRVVVVPELDLFGGDFTAADLDRLARLTAALADHPGVADEGVVLVGFSFGGAFALITAADERARAHVRLVITFGAYVDMVGLIQAATARVSIVDGERYRWTPPPEAEPALARLALTLAAPAERDELRAALAGTAEPRELGAQARAIFDVVTNTDPDRTRDLVGRLPADEQARFGAFSPVTVAHRVVAPVRAIHAVDDPVVPWAELRRLGIVMPQARTVTVASFTHVDLRRGSLLRSLVDLQKVWACTASLLSVQERWFD